MSNRIAALLGFIVVGLAMMVGGVYEATVASVKCNDKTVMQSGDVCKGRFKHPSGTYDELHSTQQVVGWAIAGLGLAVIVWAIVTTVKSSRRSTAPQQYLPPGNPAPGAGPQHYPPQPRGQYYYPPHHPPPGRPPGPPHYPPPHYPPPGPGQYRPPPPRR